MMKKLLFFLAILIFGNITIMSADIGIRGNGTSIGWDGPNDIMMTSSDGIHFTLNHVTLYSGALKFRENNSWDNNWGGNTWPSGTAIFNHNVDIQTQPGVYDITFNRTTLEYNFIKIIPIVGFRGNATTVGWDGPTDVPMTTSDGINYTANNITLMNGNLKFRENNQWTYNWGANAFPNGYANFNGADIPCQPGIYNISFNRVTTEYSFTYLFPAMGIRGDGTSVGWNGVQDIFMSTPDGVHYSVNNVTLTTGYLKFRQNNEWTNNWGGTTFPTGVGVFDQNGVDIPVQSGVFNITFNRTTLEYNFTQVFPVIGIRGAATTVGWFGMADIPLTTNDGVHYSVNNITLTAGGLKFRQDNDWPNNWGGTTFPSGIGVFDQNEVDIPCQPGIYNISFNRITLAYDFALAPCTATTTWSNNSWSNGTPDANKVAIIDSDLMITADLTACAFQVNGIASVTVTSGNNLTVNDAVLVGGNASLTLQNNANLLQALVAITNENNGNVQVNRQAEMRRLEYVYWSSPVANQVLEDFSPLTLSDRFYTLSAGTFAPVASTETFITAKGYCVRAPNTFLEAPAALQTFEAPFFGTPNNGTITIPVSNADQGFNLIGNPYPSPIDMDDFLDINAGTLYFWTHNTMGGSNYASWNEVGPTAAEAGGEAPNGFIQTGQGFILQTNTSGNATFTNAMRRDDNQGQFFRESATTEKHRIWLNLANSSGNLNQILIGYLPNATQGFDVGKDGKLLGEGSSLTSLIDNENYVIQGRGLPFLLSDEVALGFIASTTDNYTITIDHFDGLFTEDQDIFIRDTFTNTVHNLKLSSYTFAAVAGNYNNRFSIVYQSPFLSVDTTVFDKTVVVKNDNMLFFNATTPINNITIYDISGRQLAIYENINDLTFNTKALPFGHQILMVVIENNEEKSICKKVAF